MLLKWFDSKEVDAFADSLVAELRERYPPSGIQLPAAKAIERLRRTFGLMFGRIDAFAHATPLNVYKKARLGNRVQWALKEAGYAEDFVDAFVRELITHLELLPRKAARPARSK